MRRLLLGLSGLLLAALWLGSAALAQPSTTTLLQSYLDPGQPAICTACLAQNHLPGSPLPTGTPTPTRTTTTSPPNPTPTPTSTLTPTLGIFGQVTFEGEPAEAITVTLRLYLNDQFVGAVEQVATDADGDYFFENAPTLGVGEKYGVAYQNEALTPGRLAYWLGYPFAPELPAIRIRAAISTSPISRSARPIRSSRCLSP